LSDPLDLLFFLLPGRRQYGLQNQHSRDNGVSGKVPRQRGMSTRN
jgi:hypothetical protein